MTEQKRSPKSITRELGGFLACWTLAMFLLARPFRSMELGPFLGGGFTVAAIAVISLLPAFLCYVLSSCSLRVGILNYCLMVLLPNICLEMHLAPEELAFQSLVLANPDESHWLPRAEPNEWCSFSYDPYGEIIVID
ncbi:MAG: hypothetical protein ACPG31_05195 [Planctomycetota bacterium]